jgi:hypothetical protein
MPGWFPGCSTVYGHRFYIAESVQQAVSGAESVKQGKISDLLFSKSGKNIVKSQNRLSGPSPIATPGTPETGIKPQNRFSEVCEIHGVFPAARHDDRRPGSRVGPSTVERALWVSSNLFVIFAGDFTNMVLLAEGEWCI